MAKPVRGILFIPRAKNVPAWWLGAPRDGFTALAESHRQRMRNCLEFHYVPFSGNGVEVAPTRTSKETSAVAAQFEAMGEDGRMAHGFSLIGGEE